MTAKAMDNHNRWRSKTVAFRMSPEEADQLDAFVQMSGLPKQDYLIQRALQREVVVVGNPRVYKGLWIQMEVIHKELQCISTERFIDDELLDRVEQITIIMNAMREADRPTSGEAIWLARHVAATRRSRGAAEDEGGIE